jgi:hypothetical protein
MFLLKSIAAQHDLIQETYTTPANGGFKLSFSHFDGYSPMLEGGVHVNVVDTPSAEKSGQITVAVTAKSSNPACKFSFSTAHHLIYVNLLQSNTISVSFGKATRYLFLPADFLFYLMQLHPALRSTWPSPCPAASVTWISRH